MKNIVVICAFFISLAMPTLSSQYAISQENKTTDGELLGNIAREVMAAFECAGYAFLKDDFDRSILLFDTGYQKGSDLIEQIILLPAEIRKSMIYDHFPIMFSNAMGFHSNLAPNRTSFIIGRVYQHQTSHVLKSASSGYAEHQNGNFDDSYLEGLSEWRKNKSEIFYNESKCYLF